MFSTFRAKIIWFTVPLTVIFVLALVLFKLPVFSHPNLYTFIFHNKSATHSAQANSQISDQVKSAQNSSNSSTTFSLGSKKIKMLKDVGEAYMDNFGLTDADFQSFKTAGVNLLEGNFDICATATDVNYFLNQSQKYGLKVIMPAGAGEAEWGYKCDQEPYPASQKPVWQKNAVQKWVNKWKSHPAVYGWDTSNEAGSVLPNVAQEYYLTTAQLKTAYTDVKAADGGHPVMIRQNGWFYYDRSSGFFIKGNPFAKDVADIVMVNAYSNVEDYYQDFVSTVMKRSSKALWAIDSNVKILPSIGVWEEKPLWYLPTTTKLKKDLLQLEAFPKLIGVSFFKYGAKGSEWYLPKSAPKLWSVISQH